MGDVESVGHNHEFFGFGFEGRIVEFQLLQNDEFQELFGEDGGVDVISNSNGNDLGAIFEELFGLSDSEIFV